MAIKVRRRLPAMSQMQPLALEPDRIDLDSDLLQSVAQWQTAQTQLGRDLAMFLKGRGYKSNYTLTLENGTAFLAKQPTSTNGHNKVVN